MNKSSILSLAEWADRKLADKDSTINTLRTEKVMAVKEVKKQAKDKIENTEKEANKKLEEKETIIHSLSSKIEEKDAIIHSLSSKTDEKDALSSKIEEKDAIIKNKAEGVKKLLSNAAALVSESVGFNMLYIAYDEKNDTELADRLQDDLTKMMARFKFDVPISIQPGTHQATGGTVLMMDLNNKEAAITAYLGLKLKYPGIEIDKKGIMCAEVWEIFLPSVFRSTGGCQARDGGLRLRIILSYLNL